METATLVEVRWSRLWGEVLEASDAGIPASEVR